MKEFLQKFKILAVFFFINLNPHLFVLRLVFYWKVFGNVSVNFNQNLSATLTIVKKKKCTKLIVNSFLHYIVLSGQIIHQLIN